MTQTLLFKDGLRIGKRELQLLQSLGLENLSSVAQALAKELPAVITSVSGELGSELKVTASGTDVIVSPGTALLSDGTFLEVTSPITVAVGVGVTGHRVVLSATETPFAGGTVAIGAGDRFTLTLTPGGAVTSADALYASGDALRLVNGVTSLGTFRIQSVSGNTIVLADAVPGSTSLSGLKHAPAGKFFPGYPLEGITTDLLRYDTPTVTVVANATPAANEINLALVTRTGGSVAVTDTRTAFRARGIDNIVDSMVAANASIQESKLALSADLLRAKQIATKLGLTVAGDLITSQPNLYVTRGGNAYKVLVENDGVLSGFTDFAVTPAVISTTVGSSPTITASATAQAGVTVNYTFTSSNPAVLTVSQVGNVATITTVAAGTAQVIVEARSAATASYAQTSDVRYVSVNVAAAGTANAITALAITGTLSVAVGGTTTLTAVPTLAGGAAATYAWSTTSPNVEFVGATNASTVVVRGLVGSSNATVNLTVSASGTGYTTNALSTSATVAVASNTAVLAEPGFRINMVRGLAEWRWGIGGSFTVSGLNVTMTVDAADQGFTYAADALVGQGFHAAGYTYRIASNSSYNGGATLSFAVTKLNAADPNPSNGSGVVRSLATSYELKMLTANASETVLVNYSLNTTATRSYDMPYAAAVMGTTYRFRLKGINASGSYDNTIDKAWGASTVGTVDVPASPGWITPTPTTAGVSFSWPMLKAIGANSYKPDTMDYWVRYQIANASWSDWRRVPDEDNSLTTLDYMVYAAPGDVVNFQVRIRNLNNTASVNGGEYDGEATGVTLSEVVGGTDTEYVYPFDLGGVTWTLNATNGLYYYELMRYAVGPGNTTVAVDTTFTTAVAVSRIDLVFTQALSQTSGATAEVKPVVFPEDNIAYLIAGNIVQQGGTQISRATDINTTVNVNANGFITVALEYAGTLTVGQTPMSLGVDGVGRVSVWFRGAPGNAA